MEAVEPLCFSSAALTWVLCTILVNGCQLAEMFIGIWVLDGISRYPAIDLLLIH